jgi:release factor glutamine methyltransferase
LTEEEMTTAEPEVAEHEPLSALVSGVDGLDDIRQILKAARLHLSEGGLLALETGIAQHEALEPIAMEAGFSDVQSHPDLNGRERFFVARTVKPS